MNARPTPPPPRFYERCRLAPGPRASLVLAATALCGGGLVLAVRPDRTPAVTSLAGALLSVGAVTIYAARCLAAHETVLTRVSLRVGFGPFARTFACHDLLPGSSRPATGWRRFYAASELLLQTDQPHGSRHVAVPSDDPADLAAAVAALSPERT